MKHYLRFVIITLTSWSAASHAQTFTFSPVYGPATCNYLYEIGITIRLDSVLVTNIYYDDGTNGAFAFEAFVSYQNVFTASTLPPGNFYTYQISLFSDNPHLNTSTLTNNVNNVPLQTASAGGFGSANNPTFNASASALGLSQGQYYSSPSLLSQLGFDSATIHINLPCLDTVLTTKASAPLPVVWSPLKVSVTAHEVMLNWETYGEKHTMLTEIERSADGVSWKRLAGLSAPEAGENGTTVPYSYKTEEPVAGNYYYRLLLQADNGEKVYSNIAMARVGYDVMFGQPQIYPNPARSEIYIGYAAPDAPYSIIDMCGAVVRRGYYNNRIDIAGLRPGIYFFRNAGGYKRFVVAQ